MEKSTGILVYRMINDEIQVLLGKCGGPKWEKRSVGAWNIPKGHIDKGESDKECAFREFTEETSLNLPVSLMLDNVLDLGESKTSSKKIVKIFGVEYDFLNDSNKFRVDIKSNLVSTEWPPKSGERILVPELSEAFYFKLNVAKRMIFPYQRCFLERLEIQLLNKSK